MKMYVFVIDDEERVKITASCKYNAEWQFRRRKPYIELNKHKIDVFVKGRIAKEESLCQHL